MCKLKKLFRYINAMGGMAFVMTIVVLIFIISIIGIARLSIKFNNKYVKSKASEELTIKDKNGLNEREVDILESLASSIFLTKRKTDGNTDVMAIYFNNLNAYYRDSAVDLGKTAADDIAKLIRSMDELIRIEDKTDIGRMSYDGREVAIYILQKIYEMSGLRLLINSQGVIEQITDQTGIVIYQYPQEPLLFRLDTLIIVVMLILVLLSICIIIAKRNQLFEKGGEYDGFKEKGIA